MERGRRWRRDTWQTCLVLIVGLTGGIGSGKTTVAAMLGSLGAIVVDSDQLARDVVEPGTNALAEVVGAFGDAVLAADGRLDRRALAAIVFDDEGKRRTLEEIIHPRVRARLAEVAASAPADAVVVNDVPLLVESGLAGGYDRVIVVLADEETRISRLMRSRGMTAEEARARMAAQATDEQRRAVADIVIVNDGTEAELREAVEAVWRELPHGPAA
jgi:dephospho-CoA kinase